MEYEKKIVYEKEESGNKFRKVRRFNPLAIVLIISALLNVYLLGAVVSSVTFDARRIPFNKLRMAKEFKYLITRYYYKELDQEKLLESCIRGMTSVMDDPYTEYFTKDEMDDFKLSSDGRFKGIGVSMYMDDDDIVNIVDIMKGTPAERAGLRKGDKILKIDGRDGTGLINMDDIAKMISSSGGSVVLEVERPAEERKIRFVVDVEEIRRIVTTSKVFDNNIGYISLQMFDEEIDKEFKEHLNKLKKEGIKGLIIDLRDNPGGSYSKVLNVANMLIPKGKLVVYTEDKNKKRDEKYSKGPGLNMPIVVLVNNNSASASEVLAGALKHNGLATLVGKKTFGKGLVQWVQDFSDGSGLKFTVAKFFTPTGECVQDRGIAVDYKVDLPEKYSHNIVSQIPKEDDTQLNEALKIMKEKIKKK